MTRLLKPFPITFTILLCLTLTAGAWLLADNHRTLVKRQATKAAEQTIRFQTTGCGGCANHTLETATPTACGTGCGTGRGGCANETKKGETP